MNKKSGLSILLAIAILLLFVYKKVIKPYQSLNKHTQTKKAPNSLINTNVENKEIGLPIIGYQNTSEVIQHNYYTLAYNEKHEQADWVAYSIIGDNLNYNFKRAEEFVPDNLVSTGSATSFDYKGSGYDRGHLCAAADLSFSNDAVNETFFMSNISPQDHEFNTETWRILEENVRHWAKVEDKIDVVTGPVLNKLSKQKTIGETNKITVPNYYYKAIYSSTNQKAIGFIMPNNYSSKATQYFAVSIDSLENFTGINFFSNLDDNLETTIEKDLNLSDWDFQKPRKQNNHYK